MQFGSSDLWKTHLVTFVCDGSQPGGSASLASPSPWNTRNPMSVEHLIWKREYVCHMRQDLLTFLNMRTAGRKDLCTFCKLKADLSKRSGISLQEKRGLTQSASKVEMSCFLYTPVLSDLSVCSRWNSGSWKGLGRVSLVGVDVFPEHVSEGHEESRGEWKKPVFELGQGTLTILKVWTGSFSPGERGDDGGAGGEAPSLWTGRPEPEPDDKL